MFVSFKITRDGETTHYEPQPVRTGLMADMMRKAAGARTYSIRTRLSRRRDA
jgi:hypothetical protein